MVLTLIHLVLLLLHLVQIIVSVMRSCSQYFSLYPPLSEGKVTNIGGSSRLLVPTALPVIVLASETSSIVYMNR